VCVFITAGPITKLFAGGGRRRVEDMGYDRRRAEACVDESAHHARSNEAKPFRRGSLAPGSFGYGAMCFKSSDWIILGH
jgi:hypothetical protein